MKPQVFTLFYYVSVLILVAAAFAAGRSLPPQTDRTRDGLVGPVRQVTTTSGGATTIRIYDRAGALMETTSRLEPPADEPEAREQTRRLMYVYDTEKRRVEEMSQEQDGPPYLSRRYGYDPDGRLQAEAAYHMCGTFSSLHIYTYDREGRLLEDLLYQYRSLGRRIYTYDVRGHTESFLSYKNSVLQSTIHYQYDAQGRMSEQAEVLPDRTTGAKTSYEYDERGRLVVEHFTNGLHPPVDARSMYEYDEAGNWTTKKTIVGAGRLEAGSMPDAVTQRALTYF